MNHCAPTVRVSAFWKSSKGCYYLKWRPFGSRSVKTQKTEIITRSKRSKRAADKLADELQSKLNSKLNSGNEGWTWDRFCDRYLTDHLSDTSSDNRYKWSAVCKRVDAVAGRDIQGEFVLSDVSPLFLASVETALRRGIDGFKPIAVGSIPSYMATLRSGLSWAASLELMRYMPPNRRRGRQEQNLPAMRLIPISEESLRKMQDVCPGLVGSRSAASVQEYLEALWLSGCRMREPLGMHATRRDWHYPIGLDTPTPMMSWTSAQKNRRAQVARITNDFASHLRERADRTEAIYQPRCETGEVKDRTALSKLISAIGAKAEVIAEPGSPPKTATAKHFRSSMVTRWSLRGMPIQLCQEILRHSSETTTRKFYVGDLQGKIDFDESPYKQS